MKEIPEEIVDQLEGAFRRFTEYEINREELEESVSEILAIIVEKVAGNVELNSIMLKINTELVLYTDHKKGCDMSSDPLKCTCGLIQLINRFKEIVKKG